LNFEVLIPLNKKKSLDQGKEHFLIKIPKKSSFISKNSPEIIRNAELTFDYEFKSLQSDK